MAPWIIEHFTTHRVYVEPFGGGASVLLRKERSYAEVYNDLDGEIVNLFRVARDRGPELREKLELTPFAREEFEKAFDASDDPIEQARRTIVKSFMSFGADGLTLKKHTLTGFRINTKGDSIPVKSWMKMPVILGDIISRLQGVLIENRDAVRVMMDHDGTYTLNYVDPPYLHETRGRVQGYKHELTEDDHINLAEVLKSLKGNVILSGYMSPLYNRLYFDWTRVDHNAFADGARERIECIWIKDAPMSVLNFGIEVRA
jgi:DNA adenine methylase